MVSNPRDLAELLALLPSLKSIVEQYGPTNEAQIAAGIAAAVFNEQPNSWVMRAARSGSSFGRGPSAYGPLLAQDLPTFQHGGGDRLLGDTLDDRGRSILWHRSSTDPTNGRLAVESALNFGEARGTGYRHVVLSSWGWRFDDYVSPALLSNAVIECPGGIAPGAPPFADFPATSRMWNMVGVRNLRMTGVWHGRHIAQPLNTLHSLSFSGGTSGIYIDELVIEGAHTVLNFEDCSDIYIRRVIAPGAVRKLVATAGAQRIRIGEWIGDGAVSIAAGADVVIGQPQPGLLAGLSGLAPTANKAVVWNAGAAPVLEDRITDGNFSPWLSCAVPGDLTVSYATPSAIYTKIGRLVFLQLTLVATPTYTTASGDVRIGGLPHLADGGSPLARIPFFTFPTSVPWPNAAAELALAVQSGADYGRIAGFKSGASASFLPITALVSGTSYTFRLSGYYRASGAA